ncbi:ABC transporter permease subunit [Fusibacter sp. JL298sf-3]
MSNKSKKVDQKNDNAHTRRPLIARLFKSKKALSIYEEEQIQSPLTTVIKTFAANRVGMTALGIFLLVFLTVVIGPKVVPIDLAYSESSQINVPPGFDMMKVPKELDGNIKQIGIGPTFSVGLSNDGEIFVWGKSKITNTIDIKDVPKDMGKVEKIAVGHDHVLAINAEGKLFTWGNDRQKQSGIPPEVAQLNNIKDVYAGYQSSVVLTEDGKTFFFGNSRTNDYYEFHQYQGQIDKVAMSGESFIGLTYDREVVFLGSQIDGTFGRIPEMGKVVDISGTSATLAAVNENGEVFVWGNSTESQGEAKIPEFESKPVDIEGGRNHYVVLLENGKLAAWGADNFKQASIPSSVNEGTVQSYFVGFYQNYAVDANGALETWGLKGYLCGTDELGRDIFTRLLNGGRMTMTIGGVAVVISTLIAIIIGGISGFFGGRIDIFFQRISEMVASLPFLPFAMILSALIGNRMDSNQKIFMIMIILGLLTWPGLQRLIRAQVLSVREQEYVTAAKVIGINQFNIVFRHIIPNVISIIIVSATLSFSSSMLTESSLSFLGFGVQAPQPTWGNMLNGARNSIVIQNYWWRWVFASIALSICVICINLIGESLRDAIDPKSQER